jgi:hypothetical protein
MAEDGYYGYVEGEAANQINWGEIGKNMSDMLVTQKRVREEKRVAIDDASRELGEELDIAPIGTYDAGNEFILGYAENAQQYRMMTDKLLKSGQLKLKDYLVGRANINSNTETLFDLAEGWQAEHAIKMQRLKENKSQPLESVLMQDLEDMVNLRDITAMPTPANGIVNFTRTKVDKNGNKTTRAITVQQMRAETSQQFDRYQLEENTTALVKNLGISEIIGSKLVGSIRQFLKKTNTTDEKERINYKVWEDNSIDAITSNKFDTLSLLTIQGGYKPTTDKAAADADPNLIYVNTTAGGALPEVEFNKTQLTDAKEIIRNSIRAKIDNKVSAQYQREPLERQLTPTEAKEIAKKEEREEVKEIRQKIKDLTKNILSDINYDVDDATFANDSKIANLKSKFPELKIERIGGEYIDDYGDVVRFSLGDREVDIYTEGDFREGENGDKKVRNSTNLLLIQGLLADAPNADYVINEYGTRDIFVNTLPEDPN